MTALQAQTTARPSAPIYDVVICGGGLAGSTLALQLRRALPALRLLVLDKLARPLPIGAFKVGEAVTEAGAYYLDQAIGRPRYLGHNHLYKLGFRFFLGDSALPLEQRSEMGLAQWPAIESFNLDRGLLERHLREFLAEDGIETREGVQIGDVSVSEDGGPHMVCFRGPDGEQRAVQTRWLVDATGRRRLLQRKLGLSRPARDNASAIWFRVPGRLNVCDFVSPERRAWHERVPDGIRYFSTNHLTGLGYWVWLIPLSTDMTSVGLVAHNDYHDFDTYNTYERALQWFETNEPVLARHLQGVEVLDFKCMRNYSYGSGRIFSPQRWACVGEAATFIDPLYASGSDFIALANNIVTRLIELDQRDELTPDLVNYHNGLFLGTNDSLVFNVRTTYRLFDKPVVLASKVIFDFVAGWAFLAPLIYKPELLAPEVNRDLRRAHSGYFFLSRRMQEFFLQWSSLSRRRLGFDFINFLSIPLLRDVRQRHLRPEKSAAEMVEETRTSMDRAEEMAQVAFFLALEDCMPERLAQFPEPRWINAWAISLDPDRWEKDGLMRPRSAPRDLRGLYNDVRSLMTVRENS